MEYLVPAPPVVAGSWVVEDSASRRLIIRLIFQTIRRDPVWSRPDRRRAAGYGSGGWGFESLAARQQTGSSAPYRGSLHRVRTPDCTRLRPRWRAVLRRLRPPATNRLSMGRSPGLPQVRADPCIRRLWRSASIVEPSVLVMPPRGSGAAAPSGALRAIDPSARPRSWRTYGPSRLRRQSQPALAVTGPEQDGADADLLSHGRPPDGSNSARILRDIASAALCEAVRGGCSAR
jgi:hypothetical protein